MSFPIVIDAFYNEPLRVRDVALRLDYQARADYVGLSSKRYHTRGIRWHIESAFGCRIIQWESTNQKDRHANGAFFVADPDFPDDAAHIHYDIPAEWMTLLIYLTPNAPAHAGTSFWQHRRSGLIERVSKSDARSIGVRRAFLEEVLAQEAHDRRHWLGVLRVENKFNRAVLFSSRLFHSATLRRSRFSRGKRLIQAFRFKIASNPADVRASAA